MPTNTIVGSPGAIGGASGGFTIAFNNISTVPQLVAPGDAQRISITFHNPGNADIFVAPTVTQGSGSDVPLTPSTVALGGCWRVFGNGGTLQFDGECQKPWQAFSASGTGNPLTVRESRL
jgi:hypothetical protein